VRLSLGSFWQQTGVEEKTSVPHHLSSSTWKKKLGPAAAVTMVLCVAAGVLASRKSSSLFQANVHAEVELVKTGGPQPTSSEECTNDGGTGYSYCSGTDMHYCCNACTGYHTCPSNPGLAWCACMKPAALFASSFQCTYPTTVTEQCMGLNYIAQATTWPECEASCCTDDNCRYWQFDGPSWPGQCFTGPTCGSGGSTTWSYGGMKITECAGSYGADVGDEVCCGQTGTVSEQWQICPASAPTCEGFVQGSVYGTCQPSGQHPVIPKMPKCLDGTQKIELQDYAEELHDALTQLSPEQKAFVGVVASDLKKNRVYPPTDSYLYTGGIYVGYTVKLLDYMNTEVFPNLVNVIEAEVNGAIIEFDEKAYVGEFGGKIPVVASGQISNFHVWGFSLDSITANFVPGQGIQLEVSGISLSGFCNAKGHGLIFETNGNVNFGISGAGGTFILVPSVGPDGHIELSYTIEDIDTGLSASYHAHWYNDLYWGSWGPTLAIKAALATIPAIINKKIHDSVGGLLANLLNPAYTVNVPTSKKTTIDMGALAVSTYEKGMLLSVSGAPGSDSDSVTYPPPACPTDLPMEKSSLPGAFMIGFSVRQYVINGQLYMMQALGELQLTIPPSESGLTTSFDGAVDALNPGGGIGKVYGTETAMQVVVSAYQAPTVNMTGGSISVSVPLYINFSAVEAIGSTPKPIFTLSVPLQISVKGVEASTSQTTADGRAVNRTTLSASLTVLKITPMKVVSKGSGVGILAVGNVASNKIVSKFINTMVIPTIQKAMADVSVDVPLPLVNTKILLEEGALTFASDISLTPVTTTTTTTQPAPNCGSSSDCQMTTTCNGGSGYQPCYSCQQIQCNQQGRRRRNNQCSCNGN